jgi:hypothetical protein
MVSSMERVLGVDTLLSGGLVGCSVIANTLFGYWNNIANELDWKASQCNGYATMNVTWAVYWWVDRC